MCDSRHLITLQSSTACYRDIFTFVTLSSQTSRSYLNLHVSKLPVVWCRLCATVALWAKVHYYSLILLAPASISALLAWADPHPNQDVTTATGYAHRITDASYIKRSKHMHTTQPWARRDYQWATGPCRKALASVPRDRLHVEGGRGNRNWLPHLGTQCDLKIN
jgi:hypothetical protein